MNKFGNCPLCGKQIKSTNLRKIARQNQLYGFRMALDGIAATWGALIQNLRCDADLTDEQVQKIIRIGDRYWEMVGAYAKKRSALGGTNLAAAVPFGGLRGSWTTSKRR